jgi:nitrate reductase gamma subunit
MFAFLTGPMLWLSFAVCIIGCVYRIVNYVKGLNWQLDRVPYGYYRDLAVRGALRSIAHWLTPYGSRSWRLNPLFAAAFLLLHIGLVLVPLFLFGHVLVVTERFGLSWPTLPAGLADALTVLAMAGGVFIVLRRFALPEVRILTTAHDLAILGLSLAVLVTGFVASHQGGEGGGWLTAHILCGEATLVAIPFTKLSHVVLFFCSRAQIGVDFGVKRGGQRGRGIVW